MQKHSNSPVCVVIGVGPGLGLSIAKKFGREGCGVALVARRADSLFEYAALLEDEGIVANVYTADVTDLTSLDRMVESIYKSMGIPRILVYNAAVVTRLPPSALPVDTLVRDFSTNVVGALASVQRVAPDMRQNGGGTILISSAGVGVEPGSDWASYSASKAALRNLAFSMGEELSHDNIHVAVVTIAGPIVAGTNLDPDRLAGEYWRLYLQKKKDWERELFIL